MGYQFKAGQHTQQGILRHTTRIFGKTNKVSDLDGCPELVRNVKFEHWRHLMLVVIIAHRVKDELFFAPNRSARDHYGK